MKKLASRGKPFVFTLTGEKLVTYVIATAPTCPLSVCKWQATQRWTTAYDADVTNVFKLQLTSPLTGTSVVVDTLQGTIMDWKDRLTKQKLSDWSFSPVQISSICVQRALACTPLFGVY